MWNFEEFKLKRFNLPICFALLCGIDVAAIGVHERADQGRGIDAQKIMKSVKIGPMTCGVKMYTLWNTAAANDVRIQSLLETNKPYSESGLPTDGMKRLAILATTNWERGSIELDELSSADFGTYVNPFSFLPIMSTPEFLWRLVKEGVLITSLWQSRYQKEKYHSTKALYCGSFTEQETSSSLISNETPQHMTLAIHDRSSDKGNKFVSQLLGAVQKNIDWWQNKIGAGQQPPGNPSTKVLLESLATTFPEDRFNMDAGPFAAAGIATAILTDKRYLQIARKGSIAINVYRRTERAKLKRSLVFSMKSDSENINNINVKGGMLPLQNDDLILMMGPGVFQHLYDDEVRNIVQRASSSGDSQRLTKVQIEAEKHDISLGFPHWQPKNGDQDEKPQLRFTTDPRMIAQMIGFAAKKKIVESIHTGPQALHKSINDNSSGSASLNSPTAVTACWALPPSHHLHLMKLHASGQAIIGKNVNIIKNLFSRRWIA